MQKVSGEIEPVPVSVPVPPEVRPQADIPFPITGRDDHVEDTGQFDGRKRLAVALGITAETPGVEQQVQGKLIKATSLTWVGTAINQAGERPYIQVIREAPKEEWFVGLVPGDSDDPDELAQASLEVGFYPVVFSHSQGGPIGRALELAFSVFHPDLTTGDLEQFDPHHYDYQPD